MKKQRLIIESIRYITGNQDSIKIKGDVKEINAYKSILNISKKLYETLQKKNVSLREIEQIVLEKKEAASKFKDLTGQTWPL